MLTCDIQAAASLTPTLLSPWVSSLDLSLALTSQLLLAAGWAGAEDQDACHGRLHQAHHLEEGHRVRRHQLVQVLPRGVAHRSPEVSHVDDLRSPVAMRGFRGLKLGRVCQESG